jgi:hypothetical protein
MDWRSIAHEMRISPASDTPWSASLSAIAAPRVVP